MHRLDLHLRIFRPILDQCDASAGLQLANISDIDAIGTALAQGIDVCAALHAKVNDKDKLTWMVESAIKPTIPNPIHEKAYNEFMARMGDDSSTY